jgi:tRNA pseudouridine38-40 synthase
VISAALGPSWFRAIKYLESNMATSPETNSTSKALRPDSTSSTHISDAQSDDFVSSVSAFSSDPNKSISLKRTLPEDPEAFSALLLKRTKSTSPSSEIDEGSATRGGTTKKQSKKGTESRRQKNKKKVEGDQQSSSGWARRGTRPENIVAADDDSSPKTPRLPKRQCALLIGFCGSGYSGMQFQPNARTIEGTLFEALVKAGAISEDNSDDPMKVNLARAARTDAGVDAAGNVVSIKIINEIPGVDNLVAKINEELPPQIRLWDIARTVNSFNART